jgi:hypothetical protein
LDVHPPHEPIRSFRDFLLHLLTITIGLLIALALEFAVESIHFHRLVQETRRNLAREIAANRKLFTENERALLADQQLLESDIAVLRELRAAKQPNLPELHFSFSWSAFTNSSWRSARDSGAMVHMDPGDIEDYAGLYDQQDYVNQVGVGILLDEAKAAAPLLIAQNHKDSRDLSPNEVETMLLGCAELEARVVTLQQLMKPLAADYAEAARSP